MAASSSTAPSAATASRSANANVGVLAYVQEVVAGAATLLQHMPVVGDVCAAILSLKQLGETAKSNNGDLATFRDLCGVVIKGFLEQRSERSGLLEEGFTNLREHVERAKDVAKLCNGGRVKRRVLAHKI